MISAFEAWAGWSNRNRVWRRPDGTYGIQDWMVCGCASINSPDDVHWFDLDGTAWHVVRVGRRWYTLEATP